MLQASIWIWFNMHHFYHRLGLWTSYKHNIREIKFEHESLCFSSLISRLSISHYTLLWDCHSNNGLLLCDMEYRVFEKYNTKPNWVSKFGFKLQWRTCGCCISDERNANEEEHGVGAWLIMTPWDWVLLLLLLLSLLCVDRVLMWKIWN